MFIAFYNICCYKPKQITQKTAVAPCDLLPINPHGARFLGKKKMEGADKKTTRKPPGSCGCLTQVICIYINIYEIIELLYYMSCRHICLDLLGWCAVNYYTPPPQKEMPTERTKRCQATQSSGSRKKLILYTVPRKSLNFRFINHVHMVIGFYIPPNP